MSQGSSVNAGFTAASQGTLLNNVTGTPEVQRTPTIQKYHAQVQGTGVLWTPAAGKKYRLMSATIFLSKDAAAAAAENISLTDSGAGTVFTFDISSGALVAMGVTTYIPVNLPANGYLSPTINNTLSFTLSANLTAGYSTFVAWGTEE